MRFGAGRSVSGRDRQEPSAACARVVGRRPGGFTLLEVLVVLAIIGVILSFAGLSLGGREPQTATEAQRFTVLFRLAAEEAILQGRELGLRLTRDAYEFLVLEQGQWQPLTGDEVLRRRELPSGMEMNLMLDGKGLSLADRGEPAENDPQIYLLSSGEASPFQVTLRSDGAPSWRITTDGSGTIAAAEVERRR